MSDTRIDPEKFPKLSRAKYMTLLYKDLTRLGKKANIKHDYVYVRRYKFGGQKSDLILFIDVKDKEWQNVPLIKAINGTPAEDSNINTFASRASFGKCKVTAIGDMDGDGDDDVAITILTAKGPGPAKGKVIQFLDEELFEGSDVLVRLLKDYKIILQKSGIAYEDDGSDGSLDGEAEEGSDGTVDEEEGITKTIEEFNEALEEIEEGLSGKEGPVLKEWAKTLFLRNKENPNKQTLAGLIEKLEKAVDIGMDCDLTASADKLRLAGCKHLLLRLSNVQEELEDEQELGKGEDESALTNALKAIKLEYEKYKKVDKTDHEKRSKALKAVLKKITEFEPHKSNASANQLRAVNDLKERLETEEKNFSGQTPVKDLAKAASNDLKEYKEKKKNVTSASEIRKELQEMQSFFNRWNKHSDKSLEEHEKKYKEAIEKVESELKTVQEYEKKFGSFKALSEEAFGEGYRILKGIEVDYKKKITESGFARIWENFESAQGEFEKKALLAHKNIEDQLNKRTNNPAEVSIMKKHFKELYGVEL